MNIPLSHSRALRSVRNFAAACALAALLSGCQSTGTEGLVSSTAPPEISGPAASAIMRRYGEPPCRTDRAGKSDHCAQD